MRNFMADAQFQYSWVSVLIIGFNWILGNTGHMQK